MAATDKPDPMAPVGGAPQAETSPLRMVTITVDDFDPVRRFFCGVLGMVAAAEPRGGPDGEALAAHWGVDAFSVDAMVFRQPFVEGAAMLRAVRAPASAPLARPGYDSKYIGPLGCGFPIHDLDARERMANALGFQSSAGIRLMDFPRADGVHL